MDRFRECVQYAKEEMRREVDTWGDPIEWGVRGKFSAEVIQITMKWTSKHPTGGPIFKFNLLIPFTDDLKMKDRISEGVKHLSDKLLKRVMELDETYGK